MSIEDMANALSTIQVDQAKLLTQMANSLSTSGEAGVLLWLNQRKEYTFAIDIVDHFGLTPGRVANIVKKLEQRGYIERRQAPDDLRKVYIFLTDTGADRAGLLYSEMNADYIRLFKALGEEDAACAMRILRRIILYIDQGIAPHSLSLE